VTVHKYRLRDQPLSAGTWIQSGTSSLVILPYQAVRTARDPRTTLPAFCQSAYQAGARLAGWDTTSFESTWPPTSSSNCAPAPPPTSAGPKKGKPRCG
jgi:hypothetical protein